MRLIGVGLLAAAALVTGCGHGKTLTTPKVHCYRLKHPQILRVPGERPRTITGACPM
jgi:hypothetical protein